MLYTIAFVYLHLSLSYAQGPERREDVVILEQIESHLTQLDSLLFKQRGVIIQTNQYKGADIESAPHFDVDRLVERQKKTYNAKNGLSFQASYNNQMGLEVVDYSDEETIYPYRNRYQLALNWDIINSSIIGRKPAHKIFELEGLQSLYSLQKQQQQISKGSRALQSNNHWDAVMSFIHQQRIDLLNDILLLKKHLYNSRRILYGDVAEVQKEIFKAQRSYTNRDSLPTSTTQLIDLESYLSRLPMDTLGLFDKYIDTNFDLKQYPVEQQILELNKKSFSYIKQMKISAFTKLQYFGGGTLVGYSGKFNIGLSASFPLSWEHKRRKQSINYQIKVSELEHTYAQESAIIQYKKQVEILSQIDNQLKQEVSILRSIAPNITNYRAMYKKNIISVENLLFEYDAYMAVLMDIYSTIKERELLIEGLTN